MVGRDKDQNPYISLYIQEQMRLRWPDVGKELICLTDERTPWLKAARDQFVHRRGKCHTSDGQDSISNCAILELAPYTAIRITAKVLGDAFTANGEETIFKYHDKDLIITGEVVTTTPAGGEAGGSLALKSGNAVEIECKFTDVEAG